MDGAQALAQALFRRADTLAQRLRDRPDDRAEAHETRRYYPRFAIGEHTYGHPRVLDWGEGATLRIGRYCSIADGVTVFLGGEHRVEWITTYPFNVIFPSHVHAEGHPFTKGDVIIGNDVWIAHGATILSGVTLGDGAVVGCNAVVSRDVPPYAIVAGNPARVVRMRFDEATVARFREVAWWNWKHELVLRAAPLMMSRDVENFLAFAARVARESDG